jgi:hypothetical protein
MKRALFKILVATCAFVIGCMLSFDNQISVLPSIPELELRKEVRYVCSLGANRTDGRESCVCKPEEE